MHEKSIICINNVKNSVDSASASSKTQASGTAANIKRNQRDFQLQFGLQMNHELILNSTKRKQIEQTIQQTNLLSIILHCLGSTVLLAHWPNLTLDNDGDEQFSLVEYLKKIK